MTNIYGIFNEKDDQCIYVGETTRKPEVRWAEHRRQLKNGSHTNKSLQKYYDALENKDDIRFELLSSIDTDNSLLRYFFESLNISLYRPLCNKCVIDQGRGKRVVMARCDKKIAEKLIECIYSCVDKEIV